jgi:hypothetical protein
LHRWSLPNAAIVSGGKSVRTWYLAFILLLAAAGDGRSLSLDCNTEVKMMGCCELDEKSLHTQILQYGLDLAGQCGNEIIGARDQVEQQKSFDACIPADVSNEHLSLLFRA